MSGGLGWRWLGRVRYQPAVELMEVTRARVLAGEPGAETVLLCEHEPVVTLGRSADQQNLLAGPEALRARGVELHRTSRGGDVTYHGPGQLMVYPVVRLRRGLVSFLEAVTGALAEACASLGVGGAAWRRDPAGLWVGDAKLAACGIHVRRRAVIHGFALNVSTPPEAWQMIVPCGLAGLPVTSLAERRAGASAPEVRKVAELVGPLLCRRLAA